MITITAIVRPIHTPALKISPIAWHELNRIASKKAGSKNFVLFIIKNYLKEYFNVTIVVPI